MGVCVGIVAGVKLRARSGTTLINIAVIYYIQKPVQEL